MGKLGARRAQLLERHRPDRPVRPRAPAPSRPRGADGVSVRLARALVYLLEQRTKDGYVFRTDLRLRPHPPGHPLALSIEDAELYYERHGQNWERAALIKARVVAGDREAGARLPARAAAVPLAPASRLRGDPRHPLDQAADQRLSRLRHDPRAGPRPQGRARRHPRDRVLRPDPAADPGRPRAGAARGARPAPRCAPWPPPAGSTGDRRDELIEAYRFLRRVEHRLQMVADQQTHALPEEPRGRFETLAAFIGFADAAALRQRAAAPRCAAVERHYAALFEESTDLGAARAAWCSPAPTTTRRRCRRWPRWASPSRARSRRGSAPGITATIRATRSARARELLTELMPALLRALATTPRARRGVRALRRVRHAACRPACSCSRCSAPTRACSRWSPT